MLSQTNAVGVGVSVFLVVVALLVVVGILAVRHRRLARSLIAFTNTHYDSSQGTTLFTTDHNLGEFMLSKVECHGKILATSFFYYTVIMTRVAAFVFSYVALQTVLHEELTC